MMGPSAMATVRLSVIAAFAVFCWVVASVGDADARGYPGAQAESQTDAGQDPYTFPNIRLCCEPPRSRRHCCNPPTPPQPPTFDFIPVNCGLPTGRDTVGSLHEAVARVRNGGRISVMPGAPCDVTGLLIGKSIRIESAGGEYGARAVLTGGDACAVVNTAFGAGGVVIRGFDIEACVALHSGELEFSENNIAWRRQGPAIDMRGGAIRIDRSTVRARETALQASAGARVDVRDSRFATTPDGRFVIRLNVKRADLNKVLLKGARIGLHVDNVNDGLSISEFEISRVQPDDPYPAHDQGDQGIVIGDGNPLHDLPWLSGMDSRKVSINHGTINGYRVGVVMATSTSGDISEVNVNGAVTGIDIRQGAFVTLKGNFINKASNIGIILEPGARGSADSNRIRCAKSDCVCYGAECSSRSNHVFGGGLFRMTNMDCDD